MLVALDKGTFEEYPYHKIARDIAPYWNDVRIQLGIRYQENIKFLTDPITHKFGEMLRRWLRKQTCSKHEIFEKLYNALREIELIATAEIFKMKDL